MRRNLSIAVIAGALLLTMLYTACSGSTSSPTKARANAAQTIPVTVTAAKKQDLPIYLSGLGSVAAYYTVSVKSRVDGQLVDVRFKEGEFVKQGALLAVIDPRPYQVALDQAQAQLFKDQASLKDAQLNYERYKGLLQNSGAMSQQQVDTQKATADQLEGTVRNDQALVENAKLNLAYCHITAPVSGRIGLRLVDPGNIVHASDANPMLVITQLQPITALFTLPEDQLSAVSTQMRRGPLQVDAYSRDDQTKLASGRLLTIDNQVDQTTGTARLKAVFQNEESQLWPNQFVNVHLLLETRKNVTVVPSAAVQTGPQGSYVYVVKPDNTVEVRPVTVAITEANVAQIASGVTPNETVVIDGQDKLQAGTHVEPHTQSANPGGGNRNASNSGKGSPYGNAANQGNGDQSGDNHNTGNNAPPNVQSGNRVGRNRQRGQPQSSGQNMGTASQ
jgi:multidrug efflux system membrane fusion protein